LRRLGAGTSAIFTQNVRIPRGRAKQKSEKKKILKGSLRGKDLRKINQSEERRFTDRKRKGHGARVNPQRKKKGKRFA